LAISVRVVEAGVAWPASSTAAPRPWISGVASARVSAASLTHVLVEHHAKKQGERIPAEQFVGGGVLGDAQLWHAGSVPHRPDDLLVDPQLQADISRASAHGSQCTPSR
jgi:hypothetical protein